MCNNKTMYIELTGTIEHSLIHNNIFFYILIEVVATFLYLTMQKEK